MNVPATIELPGEDLIESHRRDMSRLTRAAGLVFLLALSPSVAWLAFPSATAVVAPGELTVGARHRARQNADDMSVSAARVSDERVPLASRRDALAEQVALLRAERDRITLALRHVGAQIVEAKRALARHREALATRGSPVVTASVDGACMDPEFPASRSVIAPRETIAARPACSAAARGSPLDVAADRQPTAPPASLQPCRSPQVRILAAQGHPHSRRRPWQA
jgi:hypothetical protein